MVSIKSGGAAARISEQYKIHGAAGQYKKRQRVMGSIKSGALPHGDPGSKKFMALPVSIRSGGAAATRDGQYKKWGRCRNEKWAV